MKFKPYKSALLAVSILSLSLLGGCASSSIFKAYPKQAEVIKMQLEAKQYTLAATTLNKHRDSNDKILYLMERGRAAQVANDIESSIIDYQEAKKAIEKLEKKAIISASDTGAKAASLFTNENSIPYSSEPYERIFLYHFQAMNYLFSNKLDSALVEVRRANEEQQLAFHKNEKAIIKNKQKNKDALNENSSFMSHFKSFSGIAGRVKNAYQNAYTFYASGVIWEIEGKPNDAYIDYKKALEIFPDNIYLQKDVLRLAKSLSMQSDLEKFKRQFKVKASPAVKKGGELIIFFEHGFAPVKQEIKVPLSFHKSLASVAFPTYSSKWQLTSPLAIRDKHSNTLLGTTAPIVYVQALAAQALWEDLPSMMLRQALRIPAKKEAVDKVDDAFGPMATIAASIANYATERADLRSWLTLPNDAQIYRSTLPGKKYLLQLTDGASSSTVPVRIVPGKKTLLRIISTGKTMHTNVIIL